MLKVASVVLALAVSGFLAGSGLGASAPARGAHKAPTKCVKWGKKHGKRVCVKRAKPKPKPTGGTTTTAPAGPQEGHYSATSSQGTSLQFDVAATGVAHFTLSELDSTCNPGGWLGGNHLNLTGLSAPVGSGGAFSLSTRVTFADSSTGVLAIDGTLTHAGTASGTITWSHAYTSDGTAYSCASGTITWSGGTGAAAPAAPTGPKLGHYVAMTSQNDHIQFTLGVDANGYLEATQVSVDEIDESCSPAANLTLTGFDFGSYAFFVNAGGHMHASFSVSDETFVLDAAIDSTGHATGSLHDATTISGNGTGYACDSGAVTWSGALG